MEPAPVLGEQFRTVAGRRILFDDEGFVCHADDWSEDVAEELASESGMTGLSEEQWRVIRFLREFYYENGRSPLNRRIVEGVRMSLLELERLFPGGIRYGAKRLAGLPNPKRCS
jgi:dissimilatory sulfite reductase related protein